MGEIEQIEKCLARILSERGAVVAAGFLAAPRIILTCHHVVRDALSGPAEVGQEVALDLPCLRSGRLSARLLQVDPERDLAVLRLEADPPAGARPARLVTSQETWDHHFRTFGFPEGHPDGVWADGVLRAPVAGGRLQIEDIRQTGYFVRPGFSGAPVWDDEAGGVVGMVVTVEKEPGVRAAFCIPTAQLAEFFPDLKVLARPPCPYRGLLAFREQDAPFFFGREAFAGRLLEHVERQALTAVIGSSGSGKSSVVLAGLLPRLRPRAEWAIAVCRPGREPFEELAAALFPSLEPERSETDRLREIHKLAESLRTGEISLERLARRILEKEGQERLLVVVDQWEELYTDQWEERYTPCREETCRAFVEMCLQALAEERTPLRLVLTLRADFMGQALAHRSLADALDGRTLLLGPMSREELEQAISFTLLL